MAARARASSARQHDSMDDMQPEELRVEKLVEKLETAIDGLVQKVSRPSAPCHPRPLTQPLALLLGGAGG